MPAFLLKLTGDHFVPVFFFCFILIAISALVSVTSKYLRHRAKGSAFEDPERRFLIWDESWASGRSRKSFRTRNMVAKNCLKLMLTSDTLYVRPVGIFECFGADMDLVHQIPLTSIESMELRQLLITGWLRISFKLNDGSTRQIDVFSKSQRRFEMTLRAAVERSKMSKQ